MELFLTFLKIGIVFWSLAMLSPTMLLVVTALLAFAAWLARRENHALVCGIGFVLMLSATWAANPSGVTVLAILVVAFAVGLLRRSAPAPA